MHRHMGLPDTARHTDRVVQVGPDLDTKLAALDAELLRLGRVVVAFSGGADSSLLAARARTLLGDEARAVTAVSASLAASERSECEALAREWDLTWEAVETHEIESEAYRINDHDRCYHCKAELMDVLDPMARAAGATVVLGVTTDDLGDHRPGQRAAAERGACFPLVTAGFTKSDVRQASRALQLRTWDKPAAACLASRVPYGTAVTVSVLSRVERAEAVLKGLGFEQCRVRHYDEIARVEVDRERLSDAVLVGDEIVRGVKAAGYRVVTLDLEGFRSGNLNDVLNGALTVGEGTMPNT